MIMSFWVEFVKEFTPKRVKATRRYPRMNSWETLIDMGVAQPTPAPHTTACVESKDAR